MASRVIFLNAVMVARLFEHAVYGLNSRVRMYRIYYEIPKKSRRAYISEKIMTT